MKFTRIKPTTAADIWMEAESKIAVVRYNGSTYLLVKQHGESALALMTQDGSVQHQISLSSTAITLVEYIDMASVVLELKGAVPPPSPDGNPHRDYTDAKKTIPVVLHEGLIYMLVDTTCEGYVFMDMWGRTKKDRVQSGSYNVVGYLDLADEVTSSKDYATYLSIQRNNVIQ